MTNVNNLNNITNFGHGIEEGVQVEAGITDIPQETETPEIEPVAEVVETPEADVEEVEITNQE